MVTSGPVLYSRTTKPAICILLTLLSPFVSFAQSELDQVNRGIELVNPDSNKFIGVSCFGALSLCPTPDCATRQ